MRKNKILLFIAVTLLPMVVISFSYEGGTNFNLDEIRERRNVSRILVAAKDECDDMASLKKVDAGYTIRVKRKGGVSEIPLEEYVVGVVAGEMPASFDSEALKAQAVASRTYALYKKSQRSSWSYDVTDDTRDQVYIDISSMQKKWGNTFDKYYNKVLNAVTETKNEVITHDGKIIEAFYFAMSGGSTQDSVYAFKVSRDYLVGVDSAYENNSISGFEVTREYEISKVKSALGLSCNRLVVDYVNYNDDGYVDKLSICSKKISGIDFSYKLALRSSNFKISVGDKVKITTKGFGHGVGMSQYGANGYAENGYQYDDIIKHYYTGVEISSLKQV
ncbi:MAG TPA: stage II sporulation protein D [Firmicutes bacterium]|nr:stage II sporulation protein D [Bacillota bacterium]